MKMFRKSLCKNFPISQPTRSPQSPTRSEQIQPNQSKILSSWSHWSITGKSKVTTQEKHSNNRQIHPTKLHMKPIKQSKSSVNPPSTHHHEKQNPYLKSIKCARRPPSHHHLASATVNKRKPYPKSINTKIIHSPYPPQFDPPKATLPQPDPQKLNLTILK